MALDREPHVLLTQTESACFHQAGPCSHTHSLMPVMCSAGLVVIQARCIAAQTGEKQVTRFLIGTLSLREENEASQASPPLSPCDSVFPSETGQWEFSCCR